MKKVGVQQFEAKRLEIHTSNVNLVRPQLNVEANWLG